MVKIITDTTACVAPEILEKYQIPLIPQIINFGTDSFQEGVDLNFEQFMARLKTCKELPKTAAPMPETFIKEFKRLVPLNEPILCIHPSCDVSGTVRSAQVAAEEFPGADIRVIDTRLIATPLGTLVQLAAEWAASGMDPDTIVKRIEELRRRCRIYFLVATLEYLSRGGRIGGATALLGSVLQIKPILTFEEGLVNQFEKARTHKHALARLKELVLTQIPRDQEGYLTVMHAGVPDQGNALAEDLRKQLGLKSVPVFNVPPAITIHGGPGILAVGFFVK